MEARQILYPTTLCLRPRVVFSRQLGQLPVNPPNLASAAIGATRGKSGELRGGRQRGFLSDLGQRDCL